MNSYDFPVARTVTQTNVYFVLVDNAPYSHASNVNTSECTRFFLKGVLFFNWASGLVDFFMNWVSNIALLKTYNHYHTEIPFIFTIIESMSRPRSIYITSMWCIFLFHLHFLMINRIIPWIQTHLLFCLFLEYALLFLEDNADEECE